MEAGTLPKNVGSSHCETEIQLQFSQPEHCNFRKSPFFYSNMICVITCEYSKCTPTGVCKKPNLTKHNLENQYGHRIRGGNT